MTGRCWHAAAAVTAWLVPFGSPLAGQAAGTLGIGASVVEYDGFLSSAAVVLSPSLGFETPSFSLGAQGSWTFFQSGNQVLQGTAAAGWLSPSRGWLRLELAGALGASKYAEEPGEAHVLGRARLHFSGERSGGWIGGTTGGAFGESSQVPLELAVGAWSVQGRVALVGTLTGTWLGGNRHLDLLGAARWTGARVEVEARVGARPWTQSGGGVGEARPGAYGELSALVSVGRRITLSLSGGTYPSDPVRRLLGATHLSVGLRWRFAGSRSSLVPAISGPAALTGLEAAAGPARLEIAPSGSPRTLRVHMAGARTIELMGDFTGWEPVELTHAGGTLWEIRLALTPGVHRVNVRVDGGPWLVPAGTRIERSEFGGAVGVVMVP